HAPRLGISERAYGRSQVQRSGEAPGAHERLVRTRYDAARPHPCAARTDDAERRATPPSGVALVRPQGGGRPHLMAPSIRQLSAEDADAVAEFNARLARAGVT